MNKLEMAYELLGDALQKMDKHKKAVRKYSTPPKWVDLANDRISKREYDAYHSYHPYQLEQQLVIVRRYVINMIIDTLVKIEEKEKKQ